MTTLDSMVTHAEPSPLERLQSLIHAQAASGAPLNLVVVSPSG